jgi:hypothetical protein
VSSEVCRARRACSRASSVFWGFGLAAMVVVPPRCAGEALSARPKTRSSGASRGRSGIAGRLAKATQPELVDPGGSRSRGGRWSRPSQNQITVKDQTIVQVAGSSPRSHLPRQRRRTGRAVLAVVPFTKCENVAPAATFGARRHDGVVGIPAGHGWPTSRHGPHHVTAHITSRSTPRHGRHHVTVDVKGRSTSSGGRAPSGSPR